MSVLLICSIFAFHQWPVSVLIHGAVLEKPLQAVPLCTRDPDRGPCPFVRKVWYFDYRSQRCSKFEYGGCRGNTNRFESLADCVRTCTTGHQRGHLGEQSDPGHNGVSAGNGTWDVICVQDPGEGCSKEGHIQGRTWYFYNVSSGACEQFIYYGCNGNNNRFATEFDCRMACGHLGVVWKVKTCDHCHHLSSICTRGTDSAVWCRCRPGYNRNPNGVCIDVDECEHAGEGTKCDYNAWCINTPGSYTCSCMAGYVGDGRQCNKAAVIELPVQGSTVPSAWSYPTAHYGGENILGGNPANYNTTSSSRNAISYDPWLPSKFNQSYFSHYDCHRCHRSAMCYYGICKCKAGYTGDGVTCTDTDECASRVSQCAPEASCYNTDGSFYCKCPSGFAGTGFFCVKDRDACGEPVDNRYREQCAEAHFQRRYYYDQHHRLCRMFWYDNCRGTSRNVFPDMITCREYCERGPVISTSSRTQPRPFTITAISRTAYYTTTQRPYSVITIPRTPLPGHVTASSRGQCLMPCRPGQCSGTYLMFYFNSTSRACAPFIYTGCGGNENRFLSKSSCEEACLIAPHTPELDCWQPVDYGYGRYDKQCRPRGGYAWFYDQDSDQCGRFWYQGCGGNTNRFATEQECDANCLGRSQKLRQHPKIMPFRNVRDCFHDKKEGFCYYVANKPRARYYYNHNFRQCRKFMYNGCGGNTNRFGSKDFCESTCQRTFKPKSKLCAYWPDIGPCNDRQQMWYFDLNSGTCQSFIWSGCGGNLNRFRTLEDCQSICIARKDDTCAQPKQPGLCSLSYRRFYYDPGIGICRPFIGCKGNDNNFNTIDECRRKCERFQTNLPSLKPAAQKSDHKRRKQRARRTKHKKKGSRRLEKMEKDSG